MVAATFRLPGTIGGERNWDCRYTWIRDTVFTVYASLAYDREKWRTVRDEIVGEGYNSFWDEDRLTGKQPENFPQAFAHPELISVPFQSTANQRGAIGVYRH